MISFFIIQGGLYVGIVIVAFLLIYSKRNRSNILLACSLFCIWYGLLNSYLLSANKILQYPYLFRTGNIAGYLIFPLLYLYTRNSFYPGKLLQKKEWWIFLPSLLYIIDMTPFFLSSEAHKMDLLTRYSSHMKLLFKLNESSILPGSFHFVFRYIWGLFFFILQVRIIIKNRSIWYDRSLGKNQFLYGFIIVLTSLYFPIIFPGIFGVVFKMDWYSLKFVSLSLSLTLIASTIYLLYCPHILYGFSPRFPEIINPISLLHNPEKPGDEPIEINHTVEKEKTTVDNVPANEEEEDDHHNQKQLSPEKVTAIVKQIEKYFLQTSAYTQPGYSINDLAKETDIPAYQLSPLINNYYGTNFSSWINKYRIEKFIQLSLSEKYEQLTIEGIAKMVGFKSRTTFVAAFKKEKDVTPHNYLKNRKEIS